MVPDVCEFCVSSGPGWAEVVQIGHGRVRGGHCRAPGTYLHTDYRLVAAFERVWDADAGQQEHAERPPPDLYSRFGICSAPNVTCASRCVGNCVTKDLKYAVSSGRWPTFRRNVQLPTSGSTSRPSKLAFYNFSALKMGPGVLRNVGPLLPGNRRAFLVQAFSAQDGMDM
jgi:hypothetical protein